MPTPARRNARLTLTSLGVGTAALALVDLTTRASLLVEVPLLAATLATSALLGLLHERYWGARAEVHRLEAELREHRKRLESVVHVLTTTDLHDVPEERLRFRETLLHLATWGEQGTDHGHRYR